MSWNLSQITLSRSQREIANDLEQWLLKQDSPITKAIVALRSGTLNEFDDDAMRQLERAIVTHYSPFKKAVERLRLLCKIVDFINLTNENPVPNPRIPNLHLRPANPFSSDLPSVLQLVRGWRAAIASEMERAAQNHLNASFEFQIGRLLTSAIVHGALLDSALLVAFIKSLHEGQKRLFIIHKRLTVELSISWQGEANSEHRLWYPDGLTAMLIAKLPEQCLAQVLQKTQDDSLLESLILDNELVCSDEQLRKLIWQCISEYFKAILSRDKHHPRPKSLNHMIKSVHLELQTRLPMVLTNYAARKLISHSPSTKVIARLNGWAIPNDLEKASSTIETTAPEKPTDPKSALSVTTFNQTEDNLDDIEPHWLANIRAVFNVKDQTTASKKIIQLRQELANQLNKSQIEACFVGFADSLIHTSSAAGNKLAITTAKAYFICVAKRLGGRLGDASPETFEPEILENLYSDILEDADQASGQNKQKRYIARALNEFHHYLAREFNIPRIDAREVLGHGKGLVPVDANFIQLDEYERIFNALPAFVKSKHSTIPAQDKLGRVAQLIFMLAFKCGLRRMEVLKLKSVDLNEANPSELLIRPSEARRLKTKSSTRKLPLYALLSEEELTLLKDWKVERATQHPENAPVHEQFLFGIPELTTLGMVEVISQDLLFPIIHDAMRSMTQDNTLRFHHLRHSFACWTMMRLMLSDLPKIPILFPKHPKSQDYLNESSTFRQKLYGNSELTRKNVYAVASLLGHSGPEISLEHYIHCCDVLLAIWLEQDLIATTKNTIRIQSFQAVSTAYRWVKNSSYYTAYQLTKKRWPFLNKKSTLKERTKPKRDEKKINVNTLLDDEDIFNKVYKLLREHAINSTTIEDLAIELKLPEDFAIRAVAEMKLIAAMRVGKGTKGYRHRMENIVTDRRSPNATKYIDCPVSPRKADDAAVAAKLTPKLLSFMKNEPGACEQVFSYYLNNTWQTSNELIFKNPQEPSLAENFLDFLGMLGIEKASSNFIFYHESVNSPSKMKWKKVLKLKPSHTFKMIQPPMKNKTTEQWLGIKPVFAKFDNHGQIRDSEPEASIAFRYLMVMGATIFLALNKAK